MTQGCSRSVAVWLVLTNCALAQLRFTETHRMLPTATMLSRESIAGDFDGDGDIDVAVGDSVRLGKGLVLTNQGGRLLGDDSCASPVARFDDGFAFDFDSDGDLDLATSQGLQVNQGGCFTSSDALIPNVLPYLPDALAFGDIDGDGDLDLAAGYLSGYCDIPPCQPGITQLRRNDGASGFTDISAQLASVADQPRGVAFFDYDGDLDLDLYIASGENEGFWGTHRLLANDGSGAYTDVSTLLPALNNYEEGCFGVRAEDFDGDGDLDLLIGASQLFLAQGGGFTDASAGLPGLCACEVGDVDNDGDLDAVAAHDGGVTVLNNDGAAHFAVATFDFGVEGSDLALGDYDSDGDLDAFVNTHTLGELFYNDGAGNFSILPPNIPYVSYGTHASALAAGDVDRDGDVDLFAAGRHQDRLLLNDGSGRFTSVAQLPVEDEFGTDAELVDFDGDGDLDALVSNVPDAPRLLMNDGLGVFTQFPWSSVGGHSELQMGDLDRDGDLDVLACGSSSANLVYLNDGASNLSAAPNLWPAGSSGAFVSLSDIDLDGDLDAFASNYGPTALQAYRNDGAGHFTLDTSIVNNAQSVHGHAFGDLDRDGDADLVATWTYVLRVSLNNGGAFGPYVNVPTNAGGSSLELVDIDVDGDLDAFLLGPHGILLNDGAANFSDQAVDVGWIGAESAIAVDLDSDGDADLAFATQTRVIALANRLRHLEWRSPPEIGSTTELALHGPPNAEYVLLATHAQANVPLGSLGVLRVNRNTLELRRYGRLDGQGRASEPYAIAHDPLLAGTSLYWQALIANPRKLTNLEITTFTGL